MMCFCRRHAYHCHFQVPDQKNVNSILLEKPIAFIKLLITTIVTVHFKRVAKSLMPAHNKECFKDASQKSNCKL